MSDQVDYQAFYRQLEDRVLAKEDGTLFVRTDDNHLVIVALRGGRIVSLACGPKRGDAAIPVIRRMTGGSLRVDTTPVPYHERELPSTERILQLLQPAAPAAAPPVAAARSGISDAAAAAALCRLLTRFIGPVAPLVCEQKIAAVGGLGNAARIEAAIWELAAEISTAGDAERFVERARDLLLTDRPPAQAQAVAAPAGDRVDLDEAKRALCELLAHYLGPVAPFVCEERIAVLQGERSLAALEAVVQDIAREIEDRAGAAAFVERARERLQALRV